MGLNFNTYWCKLAESLSFSDRGFHQLRSRADDAHLFARPANRLEKTQVNYLPQQVLDKW
jgi:hypothetical protein